MIESILKKGIKESVDYVEICSFVGETLIIVTNLMCLEMLEFADQ
jgi:hypothetical protein